MDKEKALKMLGEIKSILDKENIPFWLEAGTLLGAIKYKKFIPWDNDIDLGAFKKDFTSRKKKKLAQIFEKKGFAVHFFPEKIDFSKKGYDLTIQIHLAYGPEGKNFVRRMADNRGKPGKFLFKIYRLSNVSYYGKFRITASRRSAKTNLFKIITYFPKAIKNKLSNFAILRLSKLKDSGLYYITIPKNYFSKLKMIKFYGVSYKIPSSYEKYLEMQYGNWRGPAPKNKVWVWHEHGDWKKIYKREDIIS
ncbi:MAG: LicD family protein [Nanoarchaeota archaeon]